MRIESEARNGKNIKLENGCKVVKKVEDMDEDELMRRAQELSLQEPAQKENTEKRKKGCF